MCYHFGKYAVTSTQPILVVKAEAAFVPPLIVKVVAPPGPLLTINSDRSSSNWRIKSDLTY